MTETTQREGRCLCGSVQVTANNASNSVGACHCNMCRRWGGGPFMTTDCGAEVTISGEEHVSVFDSSPWAERGFCSKCGSHLFYRIKQTGQLMVPVGVFETDDGFALETQVFIDEKSAYYSFAEKTEDLTGAEIFAKYGPSA